MNFREITKYDKLGLAFALIILGLVFTLGQEQSLPHLTSDTFASEPVKTIGFEIVEHEEENLPKRVLIPSQGVDLVVDKSEIINGYWNVFENKAGWGNGSGIPGEPGNQVIFAHAKEELFLPLESIEQGESVYVLTDNGWYSYEVDKITEVYPNQTEVIAPSEDERLTLYTCSGFQDSKRLIVVAKPA